MKFKSALFSILMFAVSAAAQTIAPATASVTFDKSTQTSVSFGPVAVTAPLNTDYFYEISIPAQYASVITPVNNYNVGWIPAGTSAQVSFVSGAGLAALPVGSYNIVVSLVPLYATFQNNQNTLTYTITLNVTNSRTYVLPGANDLTVPHLAAGGVWKTVIRLINTSSAVSINELHFFNDNGQTASYLVNGFSTNFVPAVTVPAKGFVDVVVDAPAATISGTATIHTDQGSMPGVTVTYVCSNPRFQSSVEVKPSNSSGFSVAFENNSTTRTSTGFAVSNALNYDQIITLDFVDATGTSLLPVGATAPRLVVPAGGHYISVIDNDFPFTRNQKGLIRITGSQPALMGFGLIFDLNSGFFFTSPAFGN